MNEDYLDEDGYPTEAALERIKNWDYMGTDIKELFDFVKSLWCWGDTAFVMGSDVPKEYALRSCENNDGATWVRAATGGWSGNESLVRAIENSPIGMVTWRQSSWGGLHIFRIPSKQEWTGERK